MSLVLSLQGRGSAPIRGGTQASLWPTRGLVPVHVTLFLSNFFFLWFGRGRGLGALRLRPHRVPEFEKKVTLAPRCAASLPGLRLDLNKIKKWGKVPHFSSTHPTDSTTTKKKRRQQLQGPKPPLWNSLWADHPLFFSLLRLVLCGVHHHRRPKAARTSWAAILKVHATQDAGPFISRGEGGGTLGSHDAVVLKGRRQSRSDPYSGSGKKQNHAGTEYARVASFDEATLIPQRGGGW